MLRKNWNFHGDIAIQLESDACEILNMQGRPFDTIFDADAIESNYFAEAMICLVREKTKYIDSDEIEEFIKKCAQYIGINGNSIEKETAQSLYDKFRTIVF